MKKVYIIPSCEVHSAHTMPLCMSVRIKDEETEGSAGAWSKKFWGETFDDSESFDKNSDGLFD